MYGAYRTTRFVADADRSYALVATRDYSSQCMSVPFAELPNLSPEFMTLLRDSHIRRRFDGAPLGLQRNLSLRLYGTVCYKYRGELSWNSQACDTY